MPHKIRLSVQGLRLLKQHLPVRPRKGRFVAFFVLLSQTDQDGAALIFHLFRHLALHLGRPGTLPPGILENMRLVEGHLFQKLQGPGKFLLRLLGESHNHIRGQRRRVKDLPEHLAFLIVFPSGIMTIHPPQGGVASALEREMEVGTELFHSRRGLYKLLRDNAGFQRTKADAVDALHAVEKPKQLQKGASVVFAVGA